MAGMSRECIPGEQHLSFVKLYLFYTKRNRKKGTATGNGRCKIFLGSWWNSVANDVADLDPPAPVQSSSNTVERSRRHRMYNCPSPSKAMARRHQHLTRALPHARSIHSNYVRLGGGPEVRAPAGGNCLEAVQRWFVLADAGTRFVAWLVRTKIQRQMSREECVEKPRQAVR
jgi:hypothetical protein